MVFSSIVFLCGFLPLTLAIYYMCPGRLRNFFLFGASLLFYAWGEPKYILIMLFSTVFDYCNGLLLEYLERRRKPGWRKGILVLSIVGNIGILCFFKYTNFIISNINQLTGSALQLLDIVLPIGISFYTFQTLSYTIDVYWHRVRAQKNIIAFGMFVSMFPQLIAGPIVRYSDVEAELNERRVTGREMAEGMQRFLIGLGKKVILANQIGTLWDTMSGLRSSDMSVAGAWLGAAAYTFQIYFDFSGYSDMAIGMGKMLGFHFPENFRYPYEATSITDFWRRWHITMSSWFREYIYIPLGGNRKGPLRQVFNLLVVWFLTGLWHGANWNFVLWGLYFFLLLLIEKFFLLEKMKEWPVICRHLYSKFFIVISWVIFACEDSRLLFRYLRTMFGDGAVFCNQTAVYHLCSYGLLLVILCLASLSLPGKLVQWLFEKKKWGENAWFVSRSVYCIVILLISMALLIRGSYNPFLYFRF